MTKIKSFLLISIFLFISVDLFAQSIVKKGDIVIHLTGNDAFVNHRFYIDIYKKSNSVKVVYSYLDSLKHSEVGKDPEYARVENKKQEYEDNDPKRKLHWDTIGMIFERHKAYTRDSVTINLKTDTAYSNLLQRVANVDKAELAPKIDPMVLDGDSMSINIITTDKNMQAAAHAPGAKTHPLLFSFITSTLNKDRKSSAVKKIRKYYTEY
ncbi:MAG: hypothetical protein V4553_15610 [Bacteroidota bacterium]